MAHIPTMAQNDREAVLAAVKHNGNALRFATPELKNDHEIVLAAVNQYGLSIMCASDEMKNNSEIVLAAMKQNVASLYYASDELKNNHEIVLTIMNQYGNSLEHVSDELKNNPEIVLAAVNQNGLALQHASDEMKLNMEIALTALSSNFDSILHSHSSYQDGHILNQYICSYIESFKTFQNTFLHGWLSPNKNNKPDDSHNTCKLAMLNKLGKYVSINVKKLIAEYADIIYGRRLNLLKKTNESLLTHMDILKKFAR